MQPTPEKTTLVLAGAFNPAILTPQWIAVHVLGKPANQQFQVLMTGQIAGVAQLSRYTFEGLSFSPNFQNVSFFLQGQDAIAAQHTYDRAAQILHLLPHTPVNGLGCNFGFTLDHPSDQLLASLHANAGIADAIAAGSEVVANLWGAAVKWNDSVATVQCDLRGGTVNLDINFHYNVSDAASAESVLRRPNSFTTHRDAAERIAASLEQMG